MLNTALIPATTPVWTASVPALRGKSIDASGLGATETLNPAEIFRLPCPEAVETSLILNSLRSSMSAGITNPEMVLPVASPRVSAVLPSGKAFQYSTATVWFAAKPKVRSPDDPHTPRLSEPRSAKETYPVWSGTVEAILNGSFSNRLEPFEVFARIVAWKEGVMSISGWVPPN